MSWVGGWWRRQRGKVPAEGIEAHYRRLVARGEKQSWTPEDEERLRAKVSRITKATLP